METKIREQILRWLTRRDHSRQEIIQKLRIKQLPLDLAEPIIEKFIDSDLINEARFTESYIHMRQKKGYGPLRIFQELKVRGISDEIIAEQLDIHDNAWLLAVNNIWRKHFKNQLPSNISQRAKQLRFLQQRGFSHEQIKQVFTSDIVDVDNE